MKRIENVRTLNHVHEEVGVILGSVDSGQGVHEPDFGRTDKTVFCAVTDNGRFQFAAIVC